MSVILPAARGIVVCENYAVEPDGRIDLYGVFNGIRPRTYPYRRERIAVFAQLVNGIGKVPFQIHVQHAASESPTFSTKIQELYFPSRLLAVQLAMRIEGCVFDRPGVYFIQLECASQWITETTLNLH